MSKLLYSEIRRGTPDKTPQEKNRETYELTRKYQQLVLNSRYGSRPNYNARGERTGESTHLMASGERDGPDGKLYSAYPTLFQNKDGSWVDYNRGEKGNRAHPGHEAYDRGEEYIFPQEKDAKAFGHGSWKKKGPGYKNGGILYKK